MEVGYQQLCCDFLGHHVFVAFTEWGLDGMYRAFHQYDFPCAEETGTYYQWRVADLLGTNTWTLAYKCTSGSTGFHELDRFDTGHALGTPTGEVTRYGGTATSLTDVQAALQWKNQDGVWKDWSDPECFQDNAAGWEGEQLAPTSYHTTTGSADC